MAGGFAPVAAPTPPSKQLWGADPLKPREGAPVAAPPSVTATPAAPLTRAGALALGGAAGGGIVLGDRAEPATSRPSAKQDAEILNFALLLEYVQAAFYAEGVRRAGLSDELLTYAQTIGAQEQTHQNF